MEKILGYAWFSNIKGSYGIVLYINHMGELKAGISLLIGSNAQQDIQFIIEWGARFSVKGAAETIIEFGTITNRELWAKYFPTTKEK